MSKSVLVIDTPENCGKCKFISDFWCRAIYCRRVPNNDVIPGWCPLKPLPEEDHENHYPDEWEDGYADGWNDCLKEITGSQKLTVESKLSW